MVWFLERDVRFYRISRLRLYVLFSIEAQRSVINRLDDDIDGSTDVAEVPRSIAASTMSSRTVS